MKSESTIGSLFGCSPAKAFKEKSPPAYLPKTPLQNILHETPFIGWELEAEGWDGNNVPDVIADQARQYLLKEEDGSLKDFGIEFITKGPMKGEQATNSLNEIKYIEEGLKNGFKFNHRCSFHVHLNVQNLTMEQLYAVTAAYILVEPFLFSLCEDHRRGNSYCVPLNVLSLTKRTLLQGNLQHTKYWALSFNRLNDLGTIEARMMHGHVETNKLQEWIKMLQSIVIFGSILETSSNMMKLLNSIETDAQLQELAEQILQHKIQDQRIVTEMNESLFHARLFLQN